MTRPGHTPCIKCARNTRAETGLCYPCTKAEARPARYVNQSYECMGEDRSTLEYLRRPLLIRV